MYAYTVTVTALSGPVHRTKGRRCKITVWAETLPSHLLKVNPPKCLNKSQPVHIEGSVPLAACIHWYSHGKNPQHSNSQFHSQNGVFRDKVRPQLWFWYSAKIAQITGQTWIVELAPTGTQTGYHCPLREHQYTEWSHQQLLIAENPSMQAKKYSRKEGGINSSVYTKRVTGQVLGGRC